jgi:hypothetical protein
MESSKPVSLKHVPFYLTQKKFVSFSLRSHNSLTYILRTETHTLLLIAFSPFLFHTPFTSRFTSRTLNTIQEVWEGDSANWGLRAAYTFLSSSLMAHGYTPGDVNFVAQTPVLNVDLYILTSLRTYLKNI